MSSSNEIRADFVSRLRRTKFWRTLEILSPILAILIPLMLFYFSKEKSELTIQGIQLSELVKSPNNLSPNYSVEIDGKKVSNIIQFQFEIRNSGNTDIDGKEIHFLNWIPPKGLNILSFLIIKKNEHFGDFIKLKLDTNILSINLLSLNKKAYAEILINCSTTGNLNISKDFPIIKYATTKVWVVDNLNDYSQKSDFGFVHYVFEGGFWIILARIGIYGLIGIGIGILFVLSIDKLIEMNKSKKLKIFIKNLQKGVSDLDFSKLEFKEYAIETYNLLSILNQNELNILFKLYNISDSFFNNKAQFLVNNFLSPNEIEIYNGIKKKGKIESILKYDTIYYTKGFIEYFKKNAANKP
jgi:hypothetical protein